VIDYWSWLQENSLPDEVWLPAPRLEDFYLVSSHGRVYSIPYESPMPRGGTKICGGLITNGHGTGKLVFRGKNYKISRMVCEAFNGPAPFEGAIVMHDDENCFNNYFENLVWGTQKQNLNYPGFLEYCRSRTGEDSPTIKHMKKKLAEK